MVCALAARQALDVPSDPARLSVWASETRSRAGGGVGGPDAPFTARATSVGALLTIRISAAVLQERRATRARSAPVASGWASFVSDRASCAGPWSRPASSRSLGITCMCRALRLLLMASIDDLVHGPADDGRLKARPNARCTRGFRRREPEAALDSAKSRVERQQVVLGRFPRELGNDDLADPPRPAHSFPYGGH
jgi:hypothetical protein